MKSRAIPAIAAAIATAGLIVVIMLLISPPDWMRPHAVTGNEREREEEASPYGVAPTKSARCEKPDDWFFRQRAHPYGDIPQAARARGFGQATAMQAAARAALEGESDLVRGRASWQAAGPGNIGGRVTALEVHPTRPNVYFAGAADGGVLRSTDAGVTWEALTDQLPALSVGAIAIDPSDPDVIYVGTGEANAAADNYAGDGIYRSSDGGDTWTWLGLPAAYMIGRITISPADPQDIFVAVSGALYSKNEERGVYRSRDGGTTWDRTLFISDSTAAIDLVLNPQNPQLVYAAMWERIRRPGYRKVGGITSGIYRSEDGGGTWTHLTTGLPPAASDVGRIGLTLCASEPEVLYAICADDPGYFKGVYKTVNGGDSWARVNDGALASNLYSSYGWYFGNIRVSPSNPDSVYALGVPLYRSTNGGSTWQDVSGITHVDHHALYIFANNAKHVINGNDGGVYMTTTGGASWQKGYNLPISQFYAITVDQLQPQRLYGGTQDNGTLRTLTGGLDNWSMILGGDGFYVNVDPANSQVIYAESQWGWLYKSADGGYNFYDATSGISWDDRRNWSTPVIIDPMNSQTLYYGTYRLYRSTNAAGAWSAISTDLTGGPGSGNLPYGTITTIAASASSSGYLYVGTDDGRVWRSPNGGGDWFRLDTDLPDRWVTRVAIDPGDPQIAYVTLSGYTRDEFLPHVFRTDDAGATWADVSGNLPEIPVNDIVIDPENHARLFVATDAGVYMSSDLGGHWIALGGNLPNCAVDDLALHPTTRSLVAGTHGRSMFRFDLAQLAGVDEEISGLPAHEATRLQVTPSVFAPGAGMATIRYRQPATTGAAAHARTGARADTRLLILDAQGRLVRLLPPAHPAPAGAEESLTWDGRDRSGARVPAGAYFLRLEIGATVMTGRIVVAG
jgi:photosystem II stability/assembly factor-like uncharacterized protein